MAHTYHQIYLQAVFAVKYRAAVLNKTWRADIQAVMGNIINQCGCKTIIVNGVEDHMHCFFELRPAIAVSDLMQKVKGKSSKYINDHKLTQNRFEWQTGYGVFSYRKRDVAQIFKYIKNQEEHHRVKPFAEEYIELLNEFDVGYEREDLFHDPI